jgi:hypothetical protein
MQKGFAFDIEMKNASVFYPERVLPAASMMVPEMKSGRGFRPVSSKYSMYA